MRLNSKNKTRNRKRPNWRRFLRYAGAISSPTVTGFPSKEEFKNRLLNAFPHLIEAIACCRADILLKAERHAKFNGHIVRELTGLENAALGKFLVDFKRKFDNFDSWLDANSADNIKDAISKHKVN